MKRSAPLLLALLPMLVPAPATAASPFVELEKVEIFRHAGEFSGHGNPWVMTDPLNPAQWLMYYCKNSEVVEVKGEPPVHRDRLWRVENNSGGKTGWVNDQVVLQGGPSPTDSDYLSCTAGVIRVGSIWHVYYMASATTGNYFLFHATSADGVNWGHRTQISLPAVGFNFPDAPSPIFLNGQIVLYLIGDGSQLARLVNTSGDGVTFVPSTAVNAPRGGGTVAYANGTFYFTYGKRYDGVYEQPSRLYIATSLDGLNFSPLEGPLMASSGTQDRDSSRMFGPNLVVRNDELWVYYAGNYGVLPPPFVANGSVGLRRFRMAADTLTQVIEAEDVSRVTQSSPWVLGSPGAPYSGGQYLQSNVVGNQLSTTLHGRFVTVTYPTYTNLGIAKIFANSTLVGRIDMYSPSFALKRATFDLGTPQVAQIAIQVAPEKNPASSDRWLIVDRLDAGLRSRVAESEEAPVTTSTPVGAWTADDPGNTFRNGAIMVSNTTGSKLTTSLTGRYVTLSYVSYPNRGIANIRKNGALFATVDTYGAFGLRTKTWDLGSIQTATFAVEVSGAKNIASSGTYITPDRFEATSVAPGGVEAENTDYVTQSPPWAAEPGAVYSGGGALVSNTTNSALSVNLFGRYISVAYSAYPNRGIARVYRDGVLLSPTIDMYAPTFQMKRATIDLGAPFQGKIEIKVSGTKNAASTGYYLVVDRVDAWDSSPQSASFPILNTCSFDSVPPRVVAPAALQVAADCSRTPDGQTGAASPAIAAFLAGGSATDDCGAPTRLAPQVNGVDVSNATVFVEGSTGVTFRWRDAQGNIGSTTSSLRVFLKGDIEQNGNVNLFDSYRYNCILDSSCVTVQGIALTAADFNANGVIDTADRTQFQAIWNTHQCAE